MSSINYEENGYDLNWDLLIISHLDMHACNPHIHFWLLGGIVSCLIQLVIMNQ